MKKKKKDYRKQELTTRKMVSHLLHGMSCEGWDIAVSVAAKESCRWVAWFLISKTFLWEFECKDATKVGLAAGWYSGKRRPDLYRIPHALQRLLGPHGPCLHKGVCVASQCMHFLTVTGCWKEHFLWEFECNDATKVGVVAIAASCPPLLLILITFLWGEGKVATGMGLTAVEASMSASVTFLSGFESEVARKVAPTWMPLFLISTTSLQESPAWPALLLIFITLSRELVCRGVVRKVGLAPTAASWPALCLISVTFLREFVCKDGTKVGLDAGRYSGKRLPRL